MASSNARDPSFQLVDELDSLREAGQLTDVMLVCSDKEIPAHKLILSGASQYFRTMFSSIWEENTSERVELPTTSGQAMEIILPFLYTGKFKEVEDISLVKEVFQASHMLQINVLFEWCSKKITAAVCNSNFLEIYELAELYDSEGMMQHVTNYLNEHFSEIVETGEFLKMTETQIKIIIQIVASESFMDIVIKGLLRWAEVDDVEEDRQESLLQLLMMLDLQHISADYLAEMLRNKTLVMKNYRLLLLLTAEATSRTITSSKLTENANEPKLLAFGHKDEPQLFQIYDVTKNQWSSTLKILPFDMKQGMSVAWFKGHIYIFGGGDDPCSNVFKYNPVTNTIDDSGKLGIPVSFPGVAVQNEFIYIVDGRHNRNSRNTVQRYSPVSGRCETLARTLNFHRSPQAFFFEECLHTLGTCPNQNSVERYDQVDDRWTVVATIPGDINVCWTATCNKEMFVVPAQNTLTYLVYDFCSDTWESKRFSDGGPNEIVYLKSASKKGKRILLALDNKGALHVYDIELSEWVQNSHSNLKGINRRHVVFL